MARQDETRRLTTRPGRGEGTRGAPCHCPRGESHRAWFGVVANDILIQRQYHAPFEWDVVITIFSLQMAWSSHDVCQCWGILGNYVAVHNLTLSAKSSTCNDSAWLRRGRLVSLGISIFILENGVLNFVPI